MPFQPGTSPNSGGRPKKSWIKDRERMREAQASWRKLIDIRNGMVLERKTVKDFSTGEMIEVDMVPSIKDLIACCKEILNRAVGMPSQEVDLTGKEGLTVLVRAFDPDAD